ncbi:MAG: hypothetical protein CMC91_03755 [Flavobacteriaceae bacterium]|nr:hypothetical protein [Flavobacteriaceae bacterium]|tara:strand:- start:23171 stop:26218 length:3048 start_codon:yes stop_codon:yes gene_type:complete
MQVFILGAQKIKGWFSSNETSLLAKKLISGQSFLDWNINSLNEKGIKHNSISLIAGYKFKEIQGAIPKINYIVNPKWEHTHVVGSVRYALNYWDGDDLLIFYADTLFKPNVLKDFINSCSENLIAISNVSSLNHNFKYKKPKEEILQVKNNYYKNYTKTELTESKHFSGLTFLKKETVKKFKQLLKNNNSLDNLRLSNALDEFIKVDSKIKFKSFDVTNSWVELDSLDSVTKFIFGSKAETLYRLKPFIKKSFVCDQIYFDINEWNSSKESVINKIQQKFDENIIIRSSSLEEDSWENSQAGSFLSIKDVNPKNKKLLIKNIEKVINRYSKKGKTPNLNNQVLIQPFIKNASISGVVFSKTLEEGLPYYCISYDDYSKETDVVTSGKTNKIKTFTIQRNCNREILSPIIKKIIYSVEEIEKILEYSSLDLEFIIDENNKLFIVQVRPITSHKSLIESEEFKDNFKKNKYVLTNRFKKKSHLRGNINLLSDMSDWNPAEMIGVKPKPLSLSLYKYLITDSTWRKSRGMIGYNNPFPEKLLFCLGGHPYIDLRNSLNNLIPKGLSIKLSDKLINHYLNLIKQKNHLHDKIEFEVAITCYTTDIDNHLLRLKNDNFSENEINKLKTNLKDLTNKIINQKKFKIDELVNRTIILDEKRKKAIEKKYTISEIPTIIKYLLDECINLGTFPFAILARYGFIGTSMIKGLVNNKIIDENQKNKYLNSIETIVTEMLNEMNDVIENKLTLEKFLNKFGHLRPNSYSVESFTYSEKPEYYLPSEKNNYSKIKSKGKSRFKFNSKTKSLINFELREMDFDVEQLLNFIEKSISAREFSKFQFTKTLSTILDLIIEYGKNHSITRDDISFISIDKILYSKTKKSLNELVLEGKKNFHKSNEILTSGFISSINGLDIIERDENLPNFVSLKKINGEIFYLKNLSNTNDIRNKIVLIESADPGYDWIFLYNIKGLITKYGGAASHMTIRCAEFGLPAAIGCGESLFNELKNSSLINLNCNLKEITILK